MNEYEAMDVYSIEQIGQTHAPASLPQGKKPLNPVNKSLIEWVIQAIWGFRKTEKFIDF
jgi:hypothetical protein